MKFDTCVNHIRLLYWQQQKQRYVIYLWTIFVGDEINVERLHHRVQIRLQVLGLQD